MVEFSGLFTKVCIVYRLLSIYVFTMEFLEDLWITNGELVSIRDEIFTIKIIPRGLRLDNGWTTTETIKEYSISSLGQLLSFRPTFPNVDIQKKIETIQTRNAQINQQTLEQHESLFQSRI